MIGTLSYKGFRKLSYVCKHLIQLGTGYVKRFFYTNFLLQGTQMMPSSNKNFQKKMLYE